MSDHVQAAVLVQPGKYDLREYRLPEPAPGCVLVKIELSGTCGTDKHTYQGFTTQYAGTGEGKQIRLPIIQGHENVGTIAAMGGGGPYGDFEGMPLKVGDRVVVGANVCCGECHYCSHDFPYCFCQNRRTTATISAPPTRRIFSVGQYMYIISGSFLVRAPMICRRKWLFSLRSWR
jgi:L-iditol 2-dehydrogenase